MKHGSNGRSLCAFQDKLIFASGGIDTCCGKSAEKYDVKGEKWSDLPPLNESRHFHTSHCIGNKIYVFCGIHSADLNGQSIEVLDFGELRPFQRWQLISLKVELALELKQRV